MSKKSFLQGAAVLALAGVIVRIIGAIYRIPLQNFIGNQGVAYYQYAYPVFNLLLTLSTAGVPGAISKMVSERLVHDDDINARRVFYTSLFLLTGVGVFTSLAMWLGSPWIAQVAAQDNAAMALPSMVAIAPSLLLVSVLTAFRGYFQGQQRMTPTAVSQVWEQVIKIIPGFLFAIQGFQYGASLGTTLQEQKTLAAMYGAAGATWGVTLSEAVALGYLVIAYLLDRHRGKHSRGARRAAVGSGNRRAVQRRRERFGKLSRELTALALPMIAGAIFLPLSSAADMAIVSLRLKELGFDKDTSSILYGILTGMVNVLVNVPSVLSLSLSTSMIPAIADSRERGDLAAVERKSRVGMKMAMIVSIPCAVGLAVLAEPILRLLFHRDMTDALYAIGGDLLAVSSVSVIFLSIVQSTNGVLQGLGLVRVPMISLAVGALSKIVLNYILIGIPELNIHGAPWGTVACYALAATINVVCITRMAKIRFNLGSMLIRPLLAAGFMGLCAWVIERYVSPFTGMATATVLAIVAAVPAYALTGVVFGVIGKEELAFLPGGGKLSALLKRAHLLRG